MRENDGEREVPLAGPSHCSSPPGFSQVGSGQANMCLVCTVRPGCEPGTFLCNFCIPEHAITPVHLQLACQFCLEQRRRLLFGPDFQHPSKPITPEHPVQKGGTRSRNAKSVSQRGTLWRKHTEAVRCARGLQHFLFCMHSQEFIDTGRNPRQYGCIPETEERAY